MDAENGDGKKYYKENYNVFPYWTTEKLELWAIKHFRQP